MTRLLRLLCLTTFSLLAWAQVPKPGRPLVMVDAGHGGEDAGASGPRGLKEKTVALAYAQAIAAKLEASGFEAVLTRDEDRFIPLWERAKLANQRGADLFVSLHLNAARTRTATGSEVYFLSLDKGDNMDLAAAENAGAGAPPPAEDSVVAGILDDLAQKAYLQDSERLAVAIQAQLNRLAGIKARGVKQAPLIVLRGAAMPAVLVEVAFISNPAEEKKLQDPTFKTKVADAVTQGVKAYLKKATGGVRRRLGEG